MFRLAVTTALSFLSYGTYSVIARHIVYKEAYQLSAQGTSLDGLLLAGVSLALLSVLKMGKMAVLFAATAPILILILLDRYMVVLGIPMQSSIGFGEIVSYFKGLEFSEIMPLLFVIGGFFLLFSYKIQNLIKSLVFILILGISVSALFYFSGVDEEKVSETFNKAHTEFLAS